MQASTKTSRRKFLLGLAILPSAPAGDHDIERLRRQRLAALDWDEADGPPPVTVICSQLTAAATQAVAQLQRVLDQQG